MKRCQAAYCNVLCLTLLTAALSVLAAPPGHQPGSDTPLPPFFAKLAEHKVFFLNLAFFLTISGFLTIVWGRQREGNIPGAPISQDRRFLWAGRLLLVLAALSAILALPPLWSL